jgi:hypothetical protein
MRHNRPSAALAAKYLARVKSPAQLFYVAVLFLCSLAFLFPSVHEAKAVAPEPVVIGVSIPANATYTAGQVIEIAVNFSEAVTVTGTPRISADIGSDSRYFGYTSGSGTNQLRFSLSLQEGDHDADGIEIGSLTLNSGTIVGTVNAADLTLTNMPLTTGILVDAIRPKIVSFTPKNSPSIGLTNIEFDVTFNKAVTGLRVGHFTLSGSATYSGMTMSGSGASYVVTVQGFDHVGSVSLEFTPTSVITDMVGNSPSATFVSSPHIGTVKSDPIIDIAYSPLAPKVGGHVTVRVVVTSPHTPTGDVTFTLNGRDTVLSLASGVANLIYTNFPLGPYTLEVKYTGDSHNNSASEAVTITASPDTSGLALTLSASNGAATYGDNITFTANLMGGVSPTGIVTFYNGSNVWFTERLGSDGRIRSSHSSLPVGTHTITAVYNLSQYDGDPNNTTTISGSTTVTVAKASPTITMSTSGALTYGSDVTIKAKLSGAPSPTGRVLLKLNGRQSDLAVNEEGEASRIYPISDVGAFPVEMEYSGDANHNVASTTSSLTFEKATSAMSVTASRYAINVGDQVTFDATFASLAGLTGDVDFKSGSTTLGTATIIDGVATATVSGLLAGSHPIDVVYSGNDFYHSATKASALTIIVTAPVPAVSISTDKTNYLFGDAVQLSWALSNVPNANGDLEISGNDGRLGSATVTSQSGSLDIRSMLPKSGSHRLTVKYIGGDPSVTATSQAVTISVAAPDFTFTPSGGALSATVTGNAYVQQFTISGGTGALTYRLSSGALPDGLSFDGATRSISGTIDPNAVAQTYSFQIEVTDSKGEVATRNYSIDVQQGAISVPNHAVPAIVGAPNNVDLTRNATGGPFTDATIVSVTPADAGTASIVRGEFAQASGSTTLGWYLKFVPRPSYSGQVEVRYTLSNASGPSGVGTVTYSQLGYDPAGEAAEIDALAQGFVQTRQSLISSAIKVPSLSERRRMAQADKAVTSALTPSEEGMSGHFSTSLLQVQTARDKADGIGDSDISVFNLWIDGTIRAHNRDDNGGKWGGFGMVNLGADYLLSDSALVGLSLHYDRMSDPTKDDARLTGNGWMVGPYTSLELGTGVFWDASLLYGGSSNDIDTVVWDGNFSTRRWMMDTSINGEWALDDVTVLTPTLRALYFNERVADYTVTNDLGDELTTDGFDAEQFRVSLGVELTRSFQLEDGGSLKPALGFNAGYAGMDGSGLFGSVSVGLALETTDLWMLEGALLYSLEGSGEQSIGAKVKAGRQF